MCKFCFDTKTFEVQFFFSIHESWGWETYKCIDEVAIVLAFDMTFCGNIQRQSGLRVVTLIISILIRALVFDSSRCCSHVPPNRRFFFFACTPSSVVPVFLATPVFRAVVSF